MSRCAFTDYCNITGQNNTYLMYAEGGFAGAGDENFGIEIGSFTHFSKPSTFGICTNLITLADPATLDP